MNQTVSQILKTVSVKINPSEEEVNSINKFLKSFKEEVSRKFKSLGVDVDIFVGGSFAKNTVIKKDCYDVDIFLRFSDDKNISEQTAKVLKKIEGFSVIHGSRDYFNIKAGRDFFIEVIPVKKVKSPKESENITDLSYSHVNYIKRKLKNKRIIDELNNFARKTEVSILEKQFQMFEPLKTARLTDVEKIVRQEIGKLKKK